MNTIQSLPGFIMPFIISTLFTAALALLSALPVSAGTLTGRDGTNSTSLISTGWYATYHKQNLSLDDVPWQKYTHMSFFAA